MKKFILVILINIVYSSVLLAQAPVIVWSNRKTGGFNEIAYGIIVDAQDNIYIAGSVTNTADNWDFLILKYDSSGTIIWSMVK